MQQKGSIKREEAILLLEIFNVVIIEDEFVRKTVKNQTYPDEEMTLVDKQKSVIAGGVEISFCEDENHFDEILLERLNKANTKIFEYLLNCYERCSIAETKSWNQTEVNKKFIQLSKSMIINYICLAIHSEEIFENGDISIPSDFSFDLSSIGSGDEAKEIAQKLVKLMFWKMNFDLFMRVVNNLENLNLIYYNMVTLMIYGFKLVDILNPLNTRIVDTLNLLMTKIPILNNILFQMKNAPLVAGKGGKEVTEITDDVQTNYIERYSALGILIGKSFLPPSSPFMMHFMQSVPHIDKITHDIEITKTKGEFERKINKYTGIYKSYERALVKLIKFNLKDRDLGNGRSTRDETFRFFASCIKGNLNRTKLGSMIQNASQKMLNYASDNFTLTFYDILIELVRVIFVKPKMIKKIDKDFFYSVGDEFGYEEYPTIQVSKETFSQPANVGTITKFFFYAMESLHTHYIPFIKNLMEFHRNFNRLQKKLKSIPPNHPNYKKLETQMKGMKKIMILHRLILEDKERLRLTTELMTTFLGLFLDWIKFGKGGLDKDDNLLEYVPTHYLTCMSEFHQMYYNMEDNYFSRFTNFFNFALHITDNPGFFSNPHDKNKIMEQFCFYASVEVSVPVNYFIKDCPNKEGLVKGILQYFSDLEFSGQENVYYSKFMYRGSLLKFLMKIWEYPEYKELTRAVARDNKKVFDEFLGHILTDLNFCVEESYNDIPKFKDLYEKGDASLTAEERSSMKHFKDKIKSWFQNARDLLKALVLLTSIFPEEFSGDDWRKKFVLILNFYATKFMTGNFKKLQMRVTTFGAVTKVNVFKVIGINVLETIKQILRVYINVADNEKILEEIVKDERSYKDNLLIDLGKTSIKKNLFLQNDIKKLEQLISQLRTLSAKATDLKAILDDFPEEFMCQLTYELMKDPVQLPASQTIVDRSSIKQHISLNGEYDPFNRQPLTLEDCVDLPELKLKVNCWIKEQMNKAKGEVNIQQSLQDDEDDTVFEDVDEVDDRNNVYQKNF